MELFPTIAPALYKVCCVNLSAGPEMKSRLNMSRLWNATRRITD